MSDLLSHNMLVISQKAKLIETMDEYRVFDDAGAKIGTIREVEQSTTRRAADEVQDQGLRRRRD